MGSEIQETDGESTKASETSKRPRDIEVKIVERQGQTVLVEHNTKRVLVPADELRGNDIYADVLAQGIPHGEDWSTWLDGEHGEAFAAQLYATGIYTKADLLARSNEVRAALQRTLVNPLVKAMLRRAAGG